MSLGYTYLVVNYYTFIHRSILIVELCWAIVYPCLDVNHRHPSRSVQNRLRANLIQVHVFNLNGRYHYNGNT